MSRMRNGAAGFALVESAPLRRFQFAWLPLAGLLSAAVADDTIINSPHDLSTFGPGPLRAVDESRVCIFCHAPHNTSPAAPLWNRHNPTAYYRIYSSSTTDARVDQPGGSSKMCLSCHDGSVALGLVLSRDPTDPIAVNQTFMPSGPSNLTNDLSDDHPIGFRYDRQLSNRDPQVRAPDLLSERVSLGPRGELECVACHDAHNNELGDFLRITRREGALCVTCHDMSGWRSGAHALSANAVPPAITRGELLPFVSLHDNACLSCHKTHSAPQRERLLRERSPDLCLGCHDGLSARNILATSGRRSGHRPERFRDVHDAAENPRTMRPHVECVDCHNPHAARGAPLALARGLSATQGPFVPPAMELVPGVTLAGAQVERARFEYEVCFRCHADNPAPARNRIVRQRDAAGNVRRETLPTAASAHPITSPSRPDSDSPSLLPEFRASRFVRCQDCHDNPDARALGGGGPNGPHGSRFDFLLVDRYDTSDFTIESTQSFALCYRCHDRNSILNDDSFPLHRLHVVTGRSPCSACHAPHGVSGSRANHDHLINFDLSIVRGEQLFVDTGRFAGACTLTCHGVRHVNFVYGGAAGAGR